MTCDTWRAKLQPYVDAELAEGELRELEAHLRTCSACAADALGLLQMKRMTQAVAGARYAPTPQFRLQVEKKLAAKPKFTFASGWVPRFAAIVAVILIAVLAGTFWVRRTEREQALREVADLHVATLASANPVDVISSDRHTVKPWFQGKLPFTFNVPELQNSPFKLVGGRMAYLEHNPAAQLLFEVRKHHLSVFVLQDRQGLPFSSGTTVFNRLAFNAETWAQDGLRYFVISDASPDDVRQLSELLKQAR
jgi:anti-sigma factor RsiW